MGFLLNTIIYIVGLVVVLYFLFKFVIVGCVVIDMFIFKGRRRFIVASNSGRGFIVNEEDLIAQTKNGKQILNLNSDIWERSY